MRNDEERPFERTPGEAGSSSRSATGKPHETPLRREDFVGGRVLRQAGIPDVLRSPSPEDITVDGINAGDPSPAGRGKRARKSRSGSLEAMVLVLLAFLLALFLKQYVAEAYEIKGRSMEPTFENGQRVVVLKAFFGLNRGDIVVFSSTEDPSKDLIKRIVGLPDDDLKIENGALLINGQPLDEEYVLDGEGGFGRLSRPVFIGRDRYYVLGDNRPDSHDSRFFGAIPSGNIKGKVVLRWWPFAEFSSF